MKRKEREEKLNSEKEAVDVSGEWHGSNSREGGGNILPSMCCIFMGGCVVWCGGEFSDGQEENGQGDGGCLGRGMGGI